MTALEWYVTAAKIVLVIGLLLSVAPVMNWVERRGAALIQNRLGPNRIGPWGMFQIIPDGIKFMFKEDPIPKHVNGFYYFIAPIIVLIPACMTFAVIPFGDPITIMGQVFKMQTADLNVGFLYIFAMASLGVYGLIIGGWASNNKFALLGSMRSSSQMISYELSLGLSVIGMVMVFSTIELGPMVQRQAETLWQIGPLAIPKWGIFVQPLGCLIFIIVSFAEANRLPFDLPEGEPEIVGFHVEYGSMKFATFMMGEYMNMAVGSGLIATLYFGGYQLLPGFGLLLDSLQLSPTGYMWAKLALQNVSLGVKVGLFMWLFVWVRWTVPRFRYDQLMDLGWKMLLPLSLFNIFITAVMIYLGWV